MEKKALLKLVVIILLCLSYVAAVPQTRKSPMGRKVDPSSVLGHHANSEEMFNMKEGVEEERMMMDVADYPGTGPNHKHDPKSPGN